MEDGLNSAPYDRMVFGDLEWRAFARSQLSCCIRRELYVAACDERSNLNRWGWRG